ncbi:MAG: hypothetical protein Q4E74_04870 [Ruminococcus sp.]|nr:hypothetical protein [Ruminococcus sp.]
MTVFQISIDDLEKLIYTTPEMKNKEGYKMWRYIWQIIFKK